MVDLEQQRPPASWGVVVNDEAIAALATAWAGDLFELPAFDYPGTPDNRHEEWWFDYVVFSVVVLACLWPPEGEEMWRTEIDGTWLDDAPGIFAAFTKLHRQGELSPAAMARLSDEAGAELFSGVGTLQLIPERVELLRKCATAVIDHWQGSARSLIEEAGRDGRRIASLLSDTVPGYQDRPVTVEGTLPFDKLSHLAAAIMAAGVGWGAAGFHGYDDFPVYPDYMLPRVLRHHGVLVYAADLAAAVDARQLLPADSDHEHALRWGTVFAGAALRRELLDRGAHVSAPALDYRLWSEAVLGPDADAFGEHHRTITLRY